MPAVQLLSVTEGTFLVNPSALLPEWQSGSLPLAQSRAEIQVWTSVGLRGLRIVRGASRLPGRLRQAASTLLHGPSPAPLPLVRLPAWLRVSLEALRRALTSDRVGSARAGKTLQVCLVRWQLRSSQRLRLAPVAALPASP